MCAETTTVNFGWTKADPGASSTTWGTTINATIDKIDQVAWGTQQAGAPIGSIVMFGGATAPSNWLICDGRSLSTAAPYDKLFAALQYAFGGSGANFNLPNLVQNFPLGAGTNPVGTAGGAFATTIATANLPPHNHPASQDAHNHAAWQDIHNHVIATGGHSHPIHTGGHTHTGAYTHTSPSGGSFYPGAGGINILTGDVGGVGDLGGNTETAGNLGGNTDDRQPNVYTDNRQPNVYVGNTGSGAAFNVVPPFVALNFIVRFQ